MKPSQGIGIFVVMIVGIIGFLFISGNFEINQENIDKTIQNIPQGIQDAGNTAKDFAEETAIVLHGTLSEQIKKVQVESVDIIVTDVKNITKIIQDKNPVDQKSGIDKSKLEKQVHQLTNQYRIQNGLNALSWDDKLSNVARSHSQDMASRNYFSHETPDGKSPTDRGISQGYKCQKVIGILIYSGIAENIYQNNLYDKVWTTNGIPTSYDWNTLDELAHTTVDGWMDSPGHRENILTKTIDKEGIGVAIASDDKVYITQNFC